MDHPVGYGRGEAGLAQGLLDQDPDLSLTLQSDGPILKVAFVFRESAPSTCAPLCSQSACPRAPAWHHHSIASTASTLNAGEKR